MEPEVLLPCSQKSTTVPEYLDFTSLLKNWDEEIKFTDSFGVKFTGKFVGDLRAI
jgi:hypothetical protein